MAGKETQKKREEERSKLEDAGYSLLFDLAAALERNKEAVPQLPDTLNGLVEVCNFLANDADESRKGDERMRPEEKLKSMAKDIKDKSERIVTLQSTLDEKGEQIKAMEKERERYREENQTLKNERDEIKEKCREKLKDKKEKISSFETELKKKERELADEKKEREKKEQFMQQKISSSKSELNTKEKELESTKREYEKQEKSLQRRISSSESELQKKKKELEDVKREHERQEKSLQRKIKDLDRDLKDANRTIQFRLTGSSYGKDPSENSRKADTEKIMRLEERIKDLNSDLHIITAEKEQNERQMSDELKGKEETVRKLDIELKVKKEELLKALKQKKEDLTSREDEYKTVLSEKAKEANQLEERIAQLETELNKKEGDHEEEKKQIMRREDEAQQKIAQLETELSKKERDCEKEKKQLIGKVHEAQQSISELNYKLKHAKEDLENEKLQLQKEREQRGKLMTNHEDQRENVTETMTSDCDARIAQLESELSKKEGDHEEEKKQLMRREDEAQQRIAELERNLTSMNDYREKENQHLQKETEQKGKMMKAHEEHCKNNSPSDTEKIHSGCLERIGELTHINECHENEKRQLQMDIEGKDKLISELESKFTVMKEDHTNEKIQLRNEMKEKAIKLIDELESKLKVKKDDDHEKEKLQLQKEIGYKDKFCDRLIQERDTLKEKVEYYTKRLASLSEKRVKQDQCKVEDTSGLNRQSELEKDINDFFDNERIDACELIQKKYGSEEENDIHIYYPRLACMILETAYEQTMDARKAVFDLFQKMSEWMIVNASGAGRQYSRKDERYSSWPICVDVPVGNKESEHPVDIDGLMLSLKETAHHANLDCFVQDVEYIVFQKWIKWVAMENSCVLTPSDNVLVDLRGYTQACIRLTWRMVTQVPPMSLKYHSTILDKCHKRLGYHCSQEMYATGQGTEEEIACYLWPGLYDGRGRLIRPGEVLCKVKQYP